MKVTGVFWVLLLGLCFSIATPTVALTDTQQRIINDIRLLFQEDLLYRVTDVQERPEVSECLRSKGTFESGKQLVHFAENHFGGSWRTAVITALPQIDYEQFRGRKAMWANGRWQRSLRNLWLAGYPLEASIIARNTDEKTVAIIAETTGTEGTTAAALFSWLMRTPGTKGTPWASLLEIANMDPDEVLSDAARRRLRPPMSRKEFDTLTQLIVARDYEYCVLGRIIASDIVSFEALASEALGRPVSPLRYARELYAHYPRGWNDALRANGGADIQYAGNRLRRYEALKKAAEGRNGTGRSNERPDGLFPTALTQDLKTELYSRIAARITSYDLRRRDVAMVVTSSHIQDPAMTFEQLAAEATNILAIKTYEELVREIFKDLATHTSEFLLGNCVRTPIKPLRPHFR